MATRHPLHRLAEAAHSAAAQGRDDAGDHALAFAAAFAAQPLVFAGSAKAGRGHGIALLDIDGRPTLCAGTDRSAASQASSGHADALVEGTGTTILEFAQQARFDLYLRTGPGAEDVLLLDDERLLLLARMSTLSPASPAVPHDAEAVRALHPGRFADWLRGYCRAHADIGRAHLALVSLGGAPLPDVLVLLDTASPARHLERIRAEAPALLGPGRRLVGEEALGGDDAALARIRALPAMYERGRDGWWARLRQRLRPLPIAHVRIAVRDDRPGGA